MLMSAWFGACTSSLDDLRPGSFDPSDATLPGPHPVTTLPGGDGGTSSVAPSGVNPLPIPSDDTTGLTDPTTSALAPDLTDTSAVTDTGASTELTNSDLTSDTSDTSDTSWFEPDQDGGTTTLDDGAVDLPPLELLFSMPAADASGVEPDAPFTLEFNQDVRPGQGFITLAVEEIATPLEELPVTDARVTFVGATMTVDWSTELLPGQSYVVTVDAQAIVSQLQPNHAWQPMALRFATKPPPPLVLHSTTPVTNSIDVDPNAHLVLTFSETIALGEGQLQLWRAGTSDTLIESFVTAGFGAAVAGVAVSGSTLTVDPSTALGNSLTYYVTVSEGFVVSAHGAAFAGVSDSMRFRFTTAAAPPPPLLWESSVPADNALNVSPSTNIVLRFSEAIRAGTGALAVVDAESEVTVERALVTDARVSLSADTATFTLSRPLAMARSYYVTVDAGAIESLAGASFAGISTPTRLNFTTQGSPVACASDEHPAPNDRCYFVGRSMVTFSAARSACMARGSGFRLAEPRSALAQSMLEPHLTTDVWIGATDLQSEGVWRWESDGAQFWNGAANGTPVAGAYTRWRDIEPTGGSHNCARVMYVTENAGWYWADAPCDYMYQYLCEGPKR